MTIGSIVRTRPIPVLYGLMIASLVALLPLPPLLQDQAYHQFADQRELFGIPNFWNVVSNLPFVVVGAVGLLRFHRDATTTVLFIGIFLTGFGSSYYHLDPNDSTLFWDRLPMTICFAAILSTWWLNERLSIGLSAEGIPEYITQRARWCLGTIQVALLREGPLFGSGFTFTQRCHYLQAC
jgi:hypothetical protein